MKTLVLGDTHGRSFWKLIIHREKPNRVIFLGDYFDSYEIPGPEQIQNFKEIIEFKRRGECEVVLLIGNHDYHYMRYVDEQYSGYQAAFAPTIGFELEDNKEYLQMAYQMDEFLFTHAGVSSDFMDGVFGKDGWQTENIVELLNEQFKYKPLTFGFGACCNPSRLLNPYGDDTHQSPIWIRPKSLMKSNYDTLRKEVVQVVGHTQMSKIDAKGNSTGGRYWFVDTLSTSGEYLLIENNKVLVKSI